MWLRCGEQLIRHREQQPEAAPVAHRRQVLRAEPVDD